MAGGTINRFSSKRSFFFEFVLKPTLLSAAFWIAAWMRWVSPVISEPCLNFIRAGKNATRATWGEHPILEWKMGIYCFILASFCEADNAYFVFTRNYMREYAKLEGFYDEKKAEKGNLQGAQSAGNGAGKARKSKAS